MTRPLRPLAAAAALWLAVAAPMAIVADPAVAQVVAANR